MMTTMIFAQAQGAGQAAQQARDAAQQARDQAQSMRDQAQQMRDQIRREVLDQARNGGRTFTIVGPDSFHGLSRRQEGMLFAGFMFSTMAVVAIIYPIMRAIGRRLEGRAVPVDPLLGKASAERLERIEQAVEAMAIEVERISEGQRFTARLLSERADALHLPERSR